MGIMDRLFRRRRDTDISLEMVEAAAQYRDAPLEVPPGFGLYVVRCILPPAPGHQYERHYVSSYDETGVKLTPNIADAERFGPREGTDVANELREQTGLVVVLDDVPPREV